MKIIIGHNLIEAFNPTKCRDWNNFKGIYEYVACAASCIAAHRTLKAFAEINSFSEFIGYSKQNYLSNNKVITICANGIVGSASSETGEIYKTIQ